MSGGICASLLSFDIPAGVNSGQLTFTIHQFRLKIVKAKFPGAPFSSDSTLLRPALWRELVLVLSSENQRESCGFFGWR